METVRAKTVDDVLKQFEKWVEADGAEGIVVRSDSGGQYKIKPQVSLDVAVMGFTEGTDDRLGMIHDVLVGLMRRTTASTSWAASAAGSATTSAASGSAISRT